MESAVANPESAVATLVSVALANIVVIVLVRAVKAVIAVVRLVNVMKDATKDAAKDVTTTTWELVVMDVTVDKPVMTVIVVTDVKPASVAVAKMVKDATIATYVKDVKTVMDTATVDVNPNRVKVLTVPRIVSPVKAVVIPVMDVKTTARLITKACAA